MAAFRGRSKQEAEAMRALKKRGWRIQRRNGMGHLLMVWPPTGDTVLLPGVGPEHFFVKVFTTARRIEEAA